MLTSSRAFQTERLLLVKHTFAPEFRWVSPNEVFRNCPSFVRSTIQIPHFKSIYYESLYELLELPTWSTENHLKGELESGVLNMRRANQDWKTISQYVFSDLCCIVEGGVEQIKGISVQIG